MFKQIYCRQLTTKLNDYYHYYSMVAKSKLKRNHPSQRSQKAETKDPNENSRNSKEKKNKHKATIDFNLSLPLTLRSKKSDHNQRSQQASRSFQSQIQPSQCS